MNWKYLRKIPWVDTRSRFVASLPYRARLLDVGSSDGETLRHVAELRPDLRFYATDVEGLPHAYPEGCTFHRGDLNRDRLPWRDASLEGITCMHLVEHLEDLDLLFSEAKRLLTPGGRFYIETPHPKTLIVPSARGRAVGTFTLNFFDDLTHARIVSPGALARRLRPLGFEILNSGTSRNWLFALAYLLLRFAPPGRRKFTARIHWLGWSAFLIARKPQ